MISEMFMMALILRGICSARMAFMTLTSTMSILSMIVVMLFVQDIWSVHEDVDTVQSAPNICSVHDCINPCVRDICSLHEYCMSGDKENIC